MSDIKNANKEIAECVTSGYKKIEKGFVGGYKKIENAVVGAYKGIEKNFVSRFLSNEGESADETKARLEKEKADRKQDVRESAEKRAAGQKARIEAAKNKGGKRY